MSPALLALGHGFLLVLFRCSGLAMTAPVLGSPTVPARVRLAVALVFAIALFAGAGAHQVPLPESVLRLALGGAAETALGLVAGLASRWALDAALGAGHLAGIAMGLGYGALLDPVSGAEAPVIGNLFSMVAMGSAVALGAHREAVRWLARSLIAAPPGGPLDLSTLMQHASTAAVYSAVLTLRLGIPFLGAITLGHVALGLLGRTAPQLNLNNLGFSVAILAGGLSLWLLAPDCAELAARAAVQAFRN